MFGFSSPLTPLWSLTRLALPPSRPGLPARVRRRAVACLVGIVAVAGASCATIDETTLANVAVEPPVTTPVPERPLTLDDVAKVAVERNPELLAARAALGVKSAEAVRAGLWPDPNLTASVTQPDGSTQDGTGFGVGVDWDIGELFVRGTEHSAALLNVDAGKLALAWQEITVAGDARVAAAKVSSFAKQLAIAEEARTSTQQVLTQAQQAQESHDAKIDDVGVRQVAALDAESRAFDIVAQLEEAKNDLARSLGLPPGVAVQVVTPGAPPDNVADDLDKLFALAKQQRADLLALEKAYASHEQTLQAAVLRQLPHLGASIDVSHDPGNYNAIGGALTIGLPVFDGNRGNVAVENATRDQLRAEYGLRLFATRADIAKILAARGRARVARAALAVRLPQLEAAEAQMKKAAAEGNVTTVAHVEVQSALLDARLRALALDEEEIEQRLALQTAVGAPGGLR